MKASDLVFFHALARRIRRGPEGKPGKDGRSIKGDPGRDGDHGRDGVGIESVGHNPLTNRVTIELTNGRKFSYPGPKNGRDGKDGKDGIARHGKDGVGIARLWAQGETVRVKLSNGREQHFPIPVTHGRDGEDGWRPLADYGVPDSSVGESGQWYLDRNNGSWWAKIGGAWELLFKYPKGGVSGGLSERSVREIIANVNPFSGYHLNDEDSANPVKYYGYTRENSDDFYILRVDNSADPITYRYTVEGADYATAWTNRASLTYARLNEVDIP
ncbi:hypothetical protein [Zhongshania sp.]|uniref:hypothetical protein n=1 Tax=Zhongshania sp. TaxID=1971902 RepID=UPI00356191FB